jgi:hypothetical protein
MNRSVSTDLCRLAFATRLSALMRCQRLAARSIHTSREAAIRITDGIENPSPPWNPESPIRVRLVVDTVDVKRKRTEHMRVTSGLVVAFANQSPPTAGSIVHKTPAPVGKPVHEAPEIVSTADISRYPAIHKDRRIQLVGWVRGVFSWFGDEEKGDPRLDGCKFEILVGLVRRSRERRCARLSTS